MRSESVPIHLNLLQRGFRKIVVARKFLAGIAARRPTHCEGRRRDGGALFNSFGIPGFECSKLGELTVSGL
jgi:hypothetical protein